VRRPRGDGQDEREADMLGSVKALLVCGALIAAGLGAAAPAASAAVSASDTCTPTVNNIHWGTINGQATVTFVGQVECNYSTTSIELHTVLYFCGSQQPEVSKILLTANCQADTNMQTYTPEESGVTYTLSSPAATETATRTGYYASLLNFLIGGSSSGPNYGTPAYCSGGSGGRTCTNIGFAG
jgi:hypothetical protein